jgi:hypothetical protein
VGLGILKGLHTYGTQKGNILAIQIARSGPWRDQAAVQYVHIFSSVFNHGTNFRSGAAVLSEAALVVKAAKKQRMTISNFVASAAPKEAEVVNYTPGKRQ